MKLQFITHYTETYSYYDSARMALEGGCRWIQLRMKDASSEELEQEALRIQALCRQYNATFIIDDHVELVKNYMPTEYISVKTTCPLPKHASF